MSAYIVWQYDTGAIFGTGATLADAIEDARLWAGDAEIFPEYCLRCKGAWRWSYATSELIQAVDNQGGQLSWKDDSGRGIDVATLAPV